MKDWRHFVMVACFLSGFPLFLHGCLDLAVTGGMTALEYGLSGTSSKPLGDNKFQISAYGKHSDQSDWMREAQKACGGGEFFIITQTPKLSEGRTVGYDGIIQCTGGSPGKAVASKGEGEEASFTPEIDTEKSVRSILDKEGGAPISSWALKNNIPLGNILFYKRGNLVHPILFTYDNQKKEFVYQTMFRWERKEFDKRKNTAEYRKVCEEWYSNILAQTSNKYGGAGNIDLQYTYIKRIEEVSPISAYAYDVMAWFYMSPSNSTYRDVKKAAQFAEKSVSLQRHWGNVHTLACAYAESGDFEKAVQLTEEAVNKCDEEDAKKELNESLGWFKEKKTFTQMKYGKTEKEEKK